MENKYIELEKWKNLKDNGYITEEEFNIEKQRILSLKDININNKTNTKSTKIITLLIIIIVFIGIIAALVISMKLKDKIQYEKIDITTNDGTKLQINKTNLDRGICEIEKQKSVANTIGIMYYKDTIVYYLVPTFDSSKKEVTSTWDYYGDTSILRNYEINTINNSSGTVENFIRAKDKNLIATSYSVEKVLEIAGTYYIPEDYEILIISYNSSGDIKIINDQTIKIKNSREELRTMSSIEKAKKVYTINDSGVLESDLKTLYESGLYLFYDNWEDCLEDFKQAHLLIENNLAGKKYKNESNTIILNFIDNDTLEINNETTYKYTFYDGSFEIIYGENDSHLCWLTDDGKIEYYNDLLSEFK